jgi:DNA polymerase IIIc chi subunit
MMPMQNVWQYSTIHYSAYKVNKEHTMWGQAICLVRLKNTWQESDYAIIISVADKIPNNIFEKDFELPIWYDRAVARMGGYI